MATTTISHSAIGKITASTTKEGVIQCLGLQYATVADRFALAVMKEYNQNETIDATKIGYVQLISHTTIYQQYH